MATIRGFLLPEELHYQVDKHIWARPQVDGTVRLGLTPVAYALLNNTLVAVSVRPQLVGQLVARGKSLVMVESLKYIGPLAAPFAGVLVGVNERLATDPDLALSDPYGAGWIAEMVPADWDAAQADLLTGPPAIEAYSRLLEHEKISWV